MDEFPEKEENVTAEPENGESIFSAFAKDETAEKPEGGESGFSAFTENEEPASPGAEPKAEEPSAPEEGRGRFSRSEVSDASYMPHDEAPKAPKTYSYSYSDPEPKEKKSAKEKKGFSLGKTIFLILFGVLLGAVGMALASGNGKGAVTEPAAAPVPVTEPEKALEEVLPEAEEEETALSDKPRLASDTERNEMLAATEIYEIACRQVVGISTKVSYNTYFGTQSGTVTGSGFVVSEDGYILTNYHVVEYAVEGGYPITVMLYNGDSYPAEVVGHEGEDSDVAVLKIAAEGLDAVKLGDSDNMRVGETIFAVGNPLGELDYTMTKGMISAMDREISTDDSSSAINMFQIDAAVNSGNSGGPVYNMEGEVVGIVTAKYSDSYEEMGVEGLGFAIPIDDAITIANDLIENGYVRGKAYMGVSTKSVSAAAAQYYNMVEGAYIYAIVEGSCAENAGLHMGDIITAVDRFPVGSVSDLQAALKNYSAGEEAELTVYRSGETLTLSIIFDEKQPESGETVEKEQNAPYGNGQYGMGGGFSPFGSNFW